MSSNLLFSEYDLHTELQGHIGKAHGKVDAIPEAQFLCTDDQTLFEHRFSSLEIMPIQLYEDRMEMETTETKLDARYDQQRGIRFFVL